MSGDRLAGFYSLGSGINTVKNANQKETSEGAVSDLLPELALEMTDDELIGLKKNWEKQWLPESTKLSVRQKQNEDYYLGKQFGTAEEMVKNKPMADNLIYEAMETFLPKATRQNPEPVVYADDTPEGQQIADTVRKMLTYLADNKDFNLKMSLRQCARQNQLYMLGCIKVGWSEKLNNISITVIRPQKLILDANSTITNGEYTGEFIGEYRKDSAAKLVIRFPNKKDKITELVDGKMGTELQYMEWWTDQYVFWTLKDEVLDKKKNPHFNYATEQMVTDEFGNQTPQEIPGKNHFKAPKKPYTFLSIINLGLKPFDETNNVQQVISMQDLINRRWKQLDTNAANTNGGLIVSGDYYTKEQAAQAADALRKGSTLFQPRGDVNTGTRRDVGPPLPAFVYQNLVDARAELKNIYGTAGYAAARSSQEDTVRGKLLAKGQDDDRIGGGFSEFLEGMADRIFNWMVQLMFVYYDEPHMGSILGKERTREFFTLRASDFGDKELVVTVQEGSMIPKDSVSRRNEALELWGAGALDPITLFERLEFPNPRESAKLLFLWQTQPQTLFPDVAPPMMPGLPPPAPGQVQEQAPPPPSNSMLGEVPIQ